MATEAEQKAATEKAAADKTAADLKAKADAGVKAANTKAGDEGGELGDLFDDGKGDKDKGKGADKGAADLSFDVPEDMKQAMKSDVVETYRKKAQDLGLSKEQLQGFMAHQFEMARAAESERQATNDREADEIALGWKREIATDPQLGGAKLKESIRLAEAGARALGGQALAAALAKHLRGEEVIDGPMLIRAFHLAGSTMAEDRLGDPGRKGREDARPPEQRRMDKRYPSLAQKDGTTR